MLKLPVLDVDGEKLGVVNDFGIATGEVFPHVTSLAFRGPGKTPFMISWRKWVDRIDETGVYLNTSATNIRFSYLQPTELLLARDVLNKQIVDTQGMKVVRVNDIKFSMSGENQLRLLGAEVGARGLLRAISPALEHIVEGFMKHLGKPLSEDIIAWSYMDLLDRSTKNIQLSVSHKTLGELHPADIADIIEQLDPRLRAQVFAQLDTAQAAEAISEFDDDELMTEMLEGLSDTDASSMLAMMDPDDAADLIDELDYEKAEKLLRLMGVKEEKAIRNLLGYEDNTAGRIMTSEFVSLPATATVGDAIEAIRELDEDFESVYYVYTEDPSGMLTGVLSLRTLIVADRDATLGQLAYRDLVYVSPDEDQEDVTDEMTKYDLVAIPVCDENRHILGIVTFDDAMDVIAEEHQEDLQIAGVGSGDSASDDSTNVLSWFVHRQYWVVVWGIASCIMATVLGTALGSAHLVVFPMCAMPLVLLAASRMVSFVKNYFLEYDGHSRRMFAAFGVVLIGIWLMNKLVPESFMPQEDQGYFTVELELPEGATIERTREVTDRAMAFLMQDPDVEYVLNVTGSSPRVGSNQARSQLTVILKSWKERESEEISEVMKRVRDELSRYPESKVYLSTPAVIPGLGTSGGFEMVLEARGDAGYADLQRAVDTLMHYAEQRPEFTGLASSMQADIPQLYFDVDRDKAQLVGVSMSDIFSTMKAFTGSIYVNDFNMFNRIYRVYIQADAPYRAYRDNLNLFFVRGADGAMIPVTSLGTTHYTTGAGTIKRFNMFNAATITGEAAHGYSSGQAMDELENIVREKLPASVGVEWSGLSYQEKHVSGQTGLVLALAFLFVFLFLAAQYESWSVPVAVILSLPVAGIGAYLGIWVCGLENNIYFQIGLVMLVGLVAKNAILIVEFAKEEVEKGRDVVSAALKAAHLRFRPIVMTSLAFILGLLPLVFASGPGSASRQGIGTGVFFGMLVAISVGIVFVPFFFVWIYRIKAKLKKR